jgi:spore maturation protein CgeB
LGEALEKENTLRYCDLLKTAYWTDLRNCLPFYIPKGIPTSIQSLERNFKTDFDLVIECSGGGQHHLTGLRKCRAPAVHWGVDDHEPVKRKFEMFIKRDFDMDFVCHKDYLYLHRDRPHFWLPPACEPSLHKKLDVNKSYDIGFVGNLDRNVYRERVEILERLSKKFRVHSFHKIYGEEMVKILNQSRIVFHKSFNHDLSTRVFDTLACGSFLIADRIEDGMPELFQDGRHLALYGSLDELEEKIAHYLKHEDERERIAAEGHREVLAKHTFRHRAQFILEKSAVIPVRLKSDGGI